MGIFKLFDLFTSHIGVDILEISVRQHQIALTLKENLIDFSQTKELLQHVFDIKDSYITTHQDNLIVVFGGLSVDLLENTNVFTPFVKLIDEIAKEICTCPSLEFVVSEAYLKCFLDKPGLTVSDLEKYEKMLNMAGKGELVLHPQRPYLLFINEDYNPE